LRTNQRCFTIIMILVLIIFIFRRRNPDLVKPTGVISGTCTGPSGVVAGATVTLTDTNKNVVASVVSGADGSYVLPPVTLGNYHVSAVLANTDGTHLQGDADVVLSSATQTVDLAMVCFFA
jgi:hypothetical protein